MAEYWLKHDRFPELPLLHRVVPDGHELDPELERAGWQPTDPPPEPEEEPATRPAVKHVKIPRRSPPDTKEN